MIIDHHVHLGQDFYTGFSLNRENLLKKMDSSEIDKSIVFPCPNTQEWCNNPYAFDNLSIIDEANKSPDRLIPFMFVHPVLDKLSGVRDLFSKVSGFKLHSSPHVLHYNYNNVSSSEIISAMSSTGKPIIIHTGLREGSRARDALDIAKNHNGPVIFAHFARLSLPDLELLSGLKNTYLDLSPLGFLLNNPTYLARYMDRPSELKNLNQEKVVEYLHKKFPKRLLWGTDSPWCDNLSKEGYKGEVDLMKRLDLENICVNIFDITKKKF